MAAVGRFLRIQRTKASSWKNLIGVFASCELDAELPPRLGQEVCADFLLGPKLLLLQLFLIINQKIGCCAEALGRPRPSHRTTGALR